MWLRFALWALRRDASIKRLERGLGHMEPFGRVSKQKQLCPRQNTGSGVDLVAREVQLPMPG
jgi:hypothetical protein